MMDTIYGLIALAIIVCLYFFPTIMASLRQHNNVEAIGALNFLLGWTMLGWIIAFIWACTDNVDDKVKK